MCVSRRVWLVIVCVSIALTPIAWAQPKVDFSGTWVLDEAKSDPPPGGGRFHKGTLRIEQSATELKQTTSDGVNTLTVIYKLDGSESVNELPGGMTPTGTATWDGPRLVVRGKVRIAIPQGPQVEFDNPSSSSSVYSLVGSVLTITNQGKVLPSGDRAPTTSMVFTRQ
jgi:hypothetical protein